jgi:hypothetical protein
MTSPAPEDAGAVAADSAVYVYAFADAARIAASPPAADADRSVVPHRVGHICALISIVSAAAFRGPEAERNLSDPEWIMPRICRHEAIVETTMTVSPVFPAPFATLFVSLDSLSDFMRRHAGAIGDFLRHVTDQEEWSLKITAELDDLASLNDLAAALWPDWAAHTPGKRYLLLRQQRPALLRVAAEQAARHMPKIADELGALVTAIRPLAPPAASAPSVFVANYAILALVARRGALHDRIGRLTAKWAGRHVLIALSGPWPPYSFRPALDDRLQERDT